ncbi:DUF1275 domain-containing protein [Dyella ginsengisoli]|uniref:DUF1275 domain-containing protein n=1 Tax=Dyella ginsengisoli TaxID=363848 RepID=A0ABW8JWA5_9GAMM
MRHALTIEQFGLSFVAGYADTLSFIAMSGLFTAHVTGNMVLAAAHLSGQGDNLAVANLVMIPVFMAMVGLVALLARSRLFAGHPSTRMIGAFMALQFVLLVAFWVAGVAMTAHAGFPLATTSTVIPVAVLGVAALAVQNALPRLTGLQRLPTTVMTGNLTQSSIDLVGWTVACLRGQPGARAETSARMRLMAPGVAGFFVGAAVAAPMTAWLHFHALAVACAALLATTPAVLAGARAASAARATTHE